MSFLLHLLSTPVQLSTLAGRTIVLSGSVMGLNHFTPPPAEAPDLAPVTAVYLEDAGRSFAILFQNAGDGRTARMVIQDLSEVEAAASEFAAALRQASPQRKRTKEPARKQ